MSSIPAQKYLALITWSQYLIQTTSKCSAIALPGHSPGRQDLQTKLVSRIFHVFEASLDLVGADTSKLKAKLLGPINKCLHSTSDRCFVSTEQSLLREAICDHGGDGHVRQQHVLYDRSSRSSARCNKQKRCQSGLPPR